MLIFSALFVLVGLGFALPSYELEREWKQFQLAYNRNYKNPAELRYRKGIFNTNLENIKKHNEEYEAGLQSYMKGVNKFTDLTFEEVQKKLLTYKGNSASKVTVDLDILQVADNELPESIDFREKGYVTPVKDQGDCGSCWAFSAVGAIEGQLYEATKKLVTLSEQELVDCSESNFGCFGGWMKSAFKDLRKLGGIATEESYPYEGDDDECEFEEDMAVAQITGSKSLPKKEDALKKAVATIGPISVAIEVTDNFVDYKEGVFYDKSCSGEECLMNHAVLVVGYGKDNATGKDYWLVKNSWSDDWGDNGYIKMSRNRRNNCNIASAAIYPIVKPKGNFSSFADE
ncbi:unnamed protein product [Hermetia illucens]|uniref:cathepsin L n=1 Tax=Hermetia illucens TaxID=343691 RepID=A0A7R8UXW5_HERIL|nr:procathepsin L-like [Hermetia illucens]CAD7088589.1 unnamed protein product [Hermetia illucens]